MKKEEFIKELEIADYNNHTVCWVGDSISATGGYVDHIENLYPNINWLNASVGGYTSTDVVNELSNIQTNYPADKYILAIGTNDIRYFDSRGAQSITELKTNIDTILSSLSVIAIISPFPSFWQDKFARTNHLTTYNRFEKWNNELSYFYDKYVDAYTTIKNYINFYNVDNLVSDGIHPDSEGEYLYAQSLLNDNLVKGSFTYEYQPDENEIHYFKLVIHNSETSQCGIKNIKVFPYHKNSFGHSANSTNDDITGLFGSYNSSYAGFKNKLNDFPMIITFSMDQLLTHIDIVGMIENNKNIGPHKYDLYYSQSIEALTNPDHFSWEKYND